MHNHISRRQAIAKGLTATVAAAGSWHTSAGTAQAGKKDPKWEAAIEKGLKWVAKTQSSRGHWTAGGYPTAMTALAGTALIASGSTTTQGPYAKNIQRAADYLLATITKNGLIGD